MLYGLTGNPGTGKSIVASLLKKKGIDVLILYDNFKDLAKKYENIKRHYETFGDDVIKNGDYSLLLKREDELFKLFILNKESLIYLFDNVNLGRGHYLNKDPLNLEYILNTKNGIEMSEKIFSDDISTKISDLRKSTKFNQINFVKYSKLLERGFVNLFDNIIITKCSTDLQHKRLKSKGYSDGQIKILLNNRYNLDTEIKILESHSFKKLNYSTIITAEPLDKFYYVISTDKNIKSIERDIDFIIKYHNKVNKL